MRILGPLVVGFLCEYSRASTLPDNTWIELVGTIKKGNFNNKEIAILNVLSVKQTQKPKNSLVNPPDNLYLPTANMF